MLKPILSIFGDFRLENREVLSLEEINSLGLYYFASQKDDNDTIVGIYKGIPITLVETSLYVSNKNVKRIYFSGLILKIKINKRFEGITVGEQKRSIVNGATSELV